MSNWDNLPPDEMAAFRTTLRNWLDLRICSGHALAQRAGCNAMTIYNIRRGKTWTSNRMADEIMQAIGQIERAYVKQWQASRAKRGGVV